MSNREVTLPVKWITLHQVHEESACKGRPCVIHRASPHRMQYWPLTWRNDRGLFERLCDHGVGHPDPDQFGYWRDENRMYEALHSCDGCCADQEVVDERVLLLGRP